MIVVWFAVQLYLLVVLARLVLGWIEVPTAGALASFARGVHAATEPPLGVLRSVVPSLRVGTTAMDPSPFLLIVALVLVSALVWW